MVSTELVFDHLLSNATQSHADTGRERERERERERRVRPTRTRSVPSQMHRLARLAAGRASGRKHPSSRWSSRSAQQS
eukprot:COSAG03_NODE_7732_length_878_cov_2.842105_2_plen_77_part_01